METTLNTPVAALIAAPARLTRHCATLVAWLRRTAERHRRIARVVAELEAMSERDLTDLGIARCDIRRIAREAVGQPSTMAGASS